MLKCHTLIVISLFLLLIQRCRCEVYTAMVDLEDLLDTEHVLIDTVENYIKAEEQKIDLLKRYVAIYQRQQKKAREDAQSYLSNPINAYTLVKRLTADWTQVEALVNTNMNADTLANISYVKQNMKFPTDEDLNGAAVALMRLQDTYRLDTSSLARGELNGVKYSAELSAADCFELGRQSYNNGDYYHTQLWMEEAGARFKREANETVDQSDILEYLAFSIYKQGNVALALDLTNKLLELTPTHSRALGNKVYYQDQLKGQENETVKRKGDDESENIPINGPNYDDPFGKDLYEALCRGEVSTPVEVQAKLKCRYLSRDNPFLKLAPFKVEEAHLEPDLFIFHDVMSDKEIETIKRLAQPRVAISFAIPQALPLKVAGDCPMCLPTEPVMNHSFEISTFVFFVAPMTLITVLYILIGTTLSTSNMMRTRSRSNRVHSKSSRKVIKMLGEGHVFRVERPIGKTLRLN
ncbi:hypothetical protein HUJ05_011340 [Dendroctonus ponderosae]|nr:hypothetical protein HUJ05_011340 [Dendroctonus ponderosae]